MTRCGYGSVQIILSDTHRVCNIGRLLKALSSISDMQLVPTTIRSSSPVRGALDTALCKKVCQRFAEGLVFSGQGTLDLEMKLIFL